METKRLICQKCKYWKSRIEMVLPNCSATVDYCKLGLEPITPTDCDSFKRRWIYFRVEKEAK